MVKQMRPDHIDDFIPLLDMTEKILREVAVMSAHEWNVIPENSRIYYLSKELQVIFRRYIILVSFNVIFNYVELIMSIMTSTLSYYPFLTLVR